MKSKGVIIGVSAALISLAAFFFFYFHTTSAAGQDRAVGLAVQNNYSLIPVYNLQGQPMYVNAGVTPLLFFAICSPNCQKNLPEIQGELLKMHAQRPVVLVATFLGTSDVNKAESEVQGFIAKYHITMPVVLQAGAGDEYVKDVPTLLWVDKNGTHEVSPSQENLRKAVGHD